VNWEDVRECNFCGGTERRVFLKTRSRPWYEGRPLRLVECRSCGLVYASPRPVWQEQYQSRMRGDQEAEKTYVRKLNRPNVLKIHHEHVLRAANFLGRSPNMLFDMGCGAGTIMVAARNQNIEVGGNDVNGAAVRQLRDQGFDVQLCRTDQIKILHKYDIVINLDYLEHSFIPFDDLKVCHRMLAEDGILYLKTLFLNSPNHRREGENWRLFGAGHFHFFYPDVLLTMVRAAGFSIEYVDTRELITVAARRDASRVGG
jgi:hypothetical protein